MEIIKSDETEFDYSVIDTETSDFLKAKAYNLANIVNKAKTEIGKELKEAQDRLANNRNGIFEKWYKSLGYSKDNIYKLIKRYEYIVINYDNINIIEELPLSLSYEISKPTAPKELVEATLNGDITTHKQFKEMKDKLNKIEREKAELTSKLNEKPKEVVKIEKREVYPDDYEQIKKREKEYLLKVNRLQTELNQEKDFIKRNNMSRDELKREEEKILTMKKENHKLESIYGDDTNSIKKQTRLDDLLSQHKNVIMLIQGEFIGFKPCHISEKHFANILREYKEVLIRGLKFVDELMDDKSIDGEIIKEVSDIEYDGVLFE